MTLRLVGLGGLGGFEMRSGIAVPDDLPTLGRFQGLQRAMNQVLLDQIAEDGLIGPETLGAARELGFGGGIRDLAQDAGDLLQRLAEDLDATVSTDPDLSAAPARLRERLTSDGKKKKRKSAAGGTDTRTKIGLGLLGVAGVGLLIAAVRGGDDE